MSCSARGKDAVFKPTDVAPAYEVVETDEEETLASGEKACVTEVLVSRNDEVELDRGCCPYGMRWVYVSRVLEGGVG